MTGKSFLVPGLAFMGFSLYLFVMSVWGQSWKYLILALITILFSLLDGKKMSALVHDSEALKRRTGKKFSPRGILAFFSLFFIIMVIIMSLLMMLFFRIAGEILSLRDSSLITFIYSISTLISSYMIFEYLYDRKPDELRSSWGKRMEKIFSVQQSLENRSRNMLKNGGEEASISRIFSAFSGNRGQP